MNLPRLLAPVMVLAVTMLCAGCGPQASRVDAEPAQFDERAVQAWWDAPGTFFLLDAGQSAITVRVYRAGRLAHLGHNHVIEVLGLRGTLKRLASGEGVADLRFRPDLMQVDDPVARARAGEAFAAMPDAAAIAGTRRNLLGTEVLDAQAWPEVRVLGRVDALSAGSAITDLHFSVRGFGRRYQVPVSIDVADDAVTLSGRLLVRQSDLGIRPFAVLGGALQVRDEIELDFRVVGRNSSAAL